MRLQTILQNRGFLTFELLISFVLFCMVVPVAMELSLSSKKLMQFAMAKKDAAQNITRLISNGAGDMVGRNRSIYISEFGKADCDLGPEDVSKLKIYQSNSSLNSGITGTSIIAHNGYAYESADSAVRSNPDVFIFETKDPQNEKIVSSINTGPGISSIAMSGKYLFLANESLSYQLQILDISDRAHPTLISQVKLPLPEASSTPPKSTSIYFSGGKIYFGTAKWDGSEFSVIDVSNPTSPLYLGSYKIGSGVHSIRVYGARAYVATSGTEQLIVLDISDTQHISKVSSFSPSGSTILEGRFVEISSTTLYFARNGGGFNNINDYELFAFNLEKDPLAKEPFIAKDVPGGVYGMVVSKNIARKSVFIVASGGGQGSIQFLSSDTLKTIGEISLPEKPGSFFCDHTSIFIPSSGSHPYTYLKI